MQASIAARIADFGTLPARETGWEVEAAPRPAPTVWEEEAAPQAADREAEAAPRATPTDWVERLLTDRPCSPEYQEIKFAIHRKLLDRVHRAALCPLEGTPRMREDVRAAVAGLLDEDGGATDPIDKEDLIAEITEEVLGLGPLEPLLQDNSISDILVNTPGLVFVERHGKLSRTPVVFKDDAHLLRVIEKVVMRVGRQVSRSSPLVDARLPDGSRVNAAIPPVAVDGPLLSIRRFGRSGLTGEQLVQNLSLTAPMMELLKACVKGRLNILISGGTGSGKTTLLNALSSYIPEDERIVTIEDAAELRLQQTHVARLETRPTDMEGERPIQIRQLVVNALRMRPDRIIVGEVRAEEALDMLQAMNTGHDGSLTTIHANTPRDALSRLEVMVGMANANMAVRAVRQQVASAINLLVQVSRLSDGTRRVTYISEVAGMEGDIITLQDIFVFQKQGFSQGGKVKGCFRANGIRPRFCERLLAYGLELPPAMFQSQVNVG